MDFLGPKECWDIELLSFLFGTHRWIWWICRSRNLMRASWQDKSYIQSLDEFLTLDYGRAPYDVWIEASNSTYKRLLKVLVNWIALSRRVISRIYCHGLKKEDSIVESFRSFFKDAFCSWWSHSSPICDLYRYLRLNIFAAVMTLPRGWGGFKHFSILCLPSEQFTQQIVRNAADFEHNCPAWLEGGHQIFLGLQREPSLKQ